MAIRNTFHKWCMSRIPFEALGAFLSRIISRIFETKYSSFGRRLLIETVCQSLPYSSAIICIKYKKKHANMSPTHIQAI